MAVCETLIGLRLDAQSKAALEKIGRMQHMGDALAVMTSAGVFSSIFSKSNAATAAYNVTQTDWVLYIQAMRAVPNVTRRAIEKEVELMIFTYQLSNEEMLRRFWEGMLNGCR
ncbi:hypothetical protein [Pseudomonas mangiferae]|uniref:Uncharacterized protein n=1 Tax=Pseudomonas mangiferae TaxID=2593654 RepID=A0A553GWC1_9PSED|nr:hypothetical protein [Pseudomonas mangiferae]TRX73773.1 hypothetical protein FM069_15275 [Pseudomonas mangiferae]